MLVIVAQMRALPGQREALREALKANVAPTLQETGCIAYVLHQGIEDPDLFHFHEEWEDEPTWRAHLESPHINAFRQKQGDLVADRTVWQFARVV